MLKAAREILNALRKKEILKKAFESHPVKLVTMVICRHVIGHVTATGVSASCDGPLTGGWCGQHTCSAHKAGDELFGRDDQMLCLLTSWSSFQVRTEGRRDVTGPPKNKGVSSNHLLHSDWLPKNCPKAAQNLVENGPKSPP